MSRIIAIVSGKGGVGKSSVSLNIATSLALKSYKVCLIDGDFGLKNLDVMMGLENRVIYDLNDVVEGRCKINQVLVKDKRIDNLCLLPACKSLSFHQLDLKILTSLMNYLKNDFDFIIIDSPAGIEQGFLYAVSLAHEAIVVANLDLTAIRDNDRVIGILMKKGIQDISIIFNKVNNDDILMNRCMSIEEALDILSMPMLGIVYESKDMIEANNRGKPIYLDKSSLLSKCFYNITQRMLGYKCNYMKYRKKGLISRIFTNV